MKPPLDPLASYQIVLTTLGCAAILSCSAPARPAPPIVTVPNDLGSAASASVASAPADRLGPNRRHLWTWETNVRDARDRARRQERPLVVYVRADWSAGSLEMDRQVWSDPRILFPSAEPLPVALRVDVTDGADAELLAEEFAVRAVPTTIFIEVTGREVLRLEGSRSVEDVFSAFEKLRER